MVWGVRAGAADRTITDNIAECGALRKLRDSLHIEIRIDENGIAKVASLTKTRQGM
jgi:hypothetical protein